MDLRSLFNSSSLDYIDDDIKEEIPCEDTGDPISAVFIRSAPCEFPVEISNENLMVCRTCLLKTNRPLTESLSTAFTQATGVSLSDERLPRRLCHRCIAFLRKFQRFRKVSRKSDRMLRDLLDQGMLNEKSIQKTQKECEFLFSNLSVINFSPNEYTLSIIENEKDSFKTENINWKDDFYSNDNDIRNYNDIRNDIDIRNDYDIRNDNDIFKNITKHTDITHLHLKTDVSEIIDSKSNIEQQKESRKKKKTKKKKILKDDLKKISSKEIKTLNIENNQDIDNVDVFFSEVESDEDQPLILLNEKNHQKNEKTLKKIEKLVSTKKTKKRQDSSFEEYFSIEILSLEQQKEEFAKRKLTENYINSKLKCDFCFKGFLHERTFSMHMAKHTQRMGEYTCPVCHKHCTATRALRHHIDGFHKYKYTCKQCDYHTKTRCTARLHIDYHNGKKYKCEKCDQEFCRQSSLMSHRRVKHASDAVCVLCGYSYLGEKGLLFHRNFKHKLDDLNCGLLVNSAKEYCIHFNKLHSNCTRTLFPEGSKTRLCAVCGKNFQTPSMLSIHMSDCHSQTPAKHRCDTCGKTFSHRGNLSIHMNIHLGRRFPCPICGKCFNQPFNRDRHYTYVHTSIKDVKCDYCDKCFKSENEKKLHTNYVHFKKPYQKRCRGRKQPDCLPPSKKRREDFSEIPELGWNRDCESDVANKEY